MADEQRQRLDAHTRHEIERDWHDQVGLQAAGSLASLRGAVGTLLAGTVAVPRALWVAGHILNTTALWIVKVHTHYSN